MEACFFLGVRFGKLLANTANLAVTAELDEEGGALSKKVAVLRTALEEGAFETGRHNVKDYAGFVQNCEDQLYALTQEMLFRNSLLCKKCHHPRPRQPHSYSDYPGTPPAADLSPSNDPSAERSHLQHHSYQHQPYQLPDETAGSHPVTLHSQEPAYENI